MLGEMDAFLRKCGCDPLDDGQAERGPQAQSVLP
jgi:hypothetical protein